MVGESWVRARFGLRLPFAPKYLNLLRQIIPLASEGGIIPLERLDMSPGHFEHLGFAHSPISRVWHGTFRVVLVARPPAAHMLRERIEQAFELSIQPIAILLLDKVVRGPAATLLNSLSGLVMRVFRHSRGTAELARAGGGRRRR